MSTTQDVIDATTIYQDSIAAFQSAVADSQVILDALGVTTATEQGLVDAALAAVAAAQEHMANELAAGQVAFDAATAVAQLAFDARDAALGTLIQVVAEFVPPGP